MTSPPRIFLLDDHPMVLDGLSNLLRGAGLAISGQAENARTTLEHPGLEESALVLVDLALGEESGIELIKLLRRRGLAVLVYSMHESPQVIQQALDAGAVGYVTKREASGSLLEAIRTVLAGERYLSLRAEKALGMATPVDMLTGQQIRIFQLMGQGLSNDDIARQLGISVRTLESYAARIMDKLSLQSMKELRQQAIRDTASSFPVSGAAR